MAQPGQDTVFDDHFGSRRDGSPETSSAWETYNREQAERLAQQEGRATPIASTSKDGAAWEAYYRDQAKRQAMKEKYRSTSANLPPTVGVARPMVEPGEIIRRPAPRAAPLFSSYYANKPAPIFRGLRYHIHKTTPSHIFGWLRSLLIWNGASLGCFRPDIADVVILYSVTPEYHKTVDQFDPGRTTLECRAGNVWETADIYAHLARRTNLAQDKEARTRTCVVQAEWVEQCVKMGKRLEGGDKGGWEVKVNNGRFNMTSSSFENMGPAIAIAPIGSAPTLSFDFNAGTVAGGIPDEEPWVYEPPAGRAAVYDRDDIYALPPPDAPAIASSSNTSGVFCRDQILPLTFHVLNAQEHRSTIQTITRLGGGVLTALEQATFIIAPIRGSRIVEDPEMQDLVRDIDLGRAVLSVEWVEQCIDENTLVAIDNYRVTLPGVPLVNEELDELHEESSPPPAVLSRAPSPSPPPVKPDISSFFAPAPEPEAMRIRKRPRKSTATPRASTSMLPTPRSSPAPARTRESTSPEMTHIPSPAIVRKPTIPVVKPKRQIIDLTLSDDDEEEGVENILVLPEPTPAPASPPKAQRKGPRWATEENPIEPAPREERGPTPSLFRLTPSARRRKEESSAP